MNMNNTTDRSAEGEDPSRTPEAIAASLGVNVESHTVLGITPDFIWYEAAQLQRDMSAWTSRLQRLVNVMEQRAADNTKMLQQVMDENRDLKKKLAGVQELLK